MISYSSGRQGKKSKSCRKTKQKYLVYKYFLILPACFAFFTLELTILKSVHFNTQLHDPHFFQNCGTFQYNISWLCFDVSWCCIEKYHNFERNEDRTTVILKWTDFSSKNTWIKSILLLSNNFWTVVVFTHFYHPKTQLLNFWQECFCCKYICWQSSFDLGGKFHPLFLS